MSSHTMNCLCKKILVMFFSDSVSYTASEKNDTDVAHYNFNTDQPILINFWQRHCWDSMLSNGDLFSYLSWLVSLHYLGKHEPRKLSFLVTVANWVFAETTHIVGWKWNFAWWVVFRRCSKIRMSSKFIKQFQSCGVEICHFPLIWPLVYTKSHSCSKLRK